MVYDINWDEVTWVFESFTIGNINPTVGAPKSVGQVLFNNCTKAKQEHKWSEDFEVEESFTYSFTEGLELGIEVEVETNFLVGKASTTLSAKMDFSATQEKTVKTTSKHSVEEDYHIDPCSHFEAKYLVYRGTFKGIKFEATVKAEGKLSWKAHTFSGEQSENIEKILEKARIPNKFVAQGKLGSKTAVSETKTITGSRKVTAEDCKGVPTECLD